MHKYSIQYWGRNRYGDYDWVVEYIYADSESLAIEELKKVDTTFKHPYEILNIEKQWNTFGQA